MAKNKKTDEQNLLNNPNDKYFKKLFTFIVVVRDYLNSLFPKHLREKLDLSTLELDTTTYITTELNEYYSDIVWRCQLLNKKKSVHICFIFEHKSYVPDYPHVQIGDYKQGAYNKQLAAGQPLSVVVPIIVYHGIKKWLVKPFSSYFGDIDKDFHRFIDPYEYYLTNLADYSDKMIEGFQTIFLQKAFLAMKHYREKAYIRKRFVELVFLGFENNNSKETLDFVRSLFVYLSNILGGITEKEINKQIEQFDNNLKKEAMYNYIDELLERGEKRGIEKGIEQGIEQGIEMGKKIAIYEAYQRGGTIDVLSRLFDLPSTAIVQIIEEAKKRKF